MTAHTCQFAYRFFSFTYFYGGKALLGLANRAQV